MKAIIKGKRYDTETAELLAPVPCSYGRSDFRYHDTSIYRTAKGNYFITGEGGPMTMWAKAAVGGGYTGGRGIRPLSVDEAREYLERCGAEGTSAIEKYFPVEDA